MQPSRREFVKWVTASGIALSMSRLGSAEEIGFATRETLTGSPRPPVQNSTPRIFVPQISPGGRLRHRTPFLSAPPMQRTSTPAWISRASAAR